MALEREVRAIELQQKAAPDDRLVLPAQRRRECGEIGLFAVVILVLHRPGDDPGRRCGHERLDELRAGVVERRLEVGALGLNRGGSQVTDLADRLGRPHVADCLSGSELLLHHLQKDRIAQRIGARAALPRPAKTAHAVADMEKEPFALLLAIVADVDTRLGLLFYDPAQRRPPQLVDLRRINRFAPGAAHIEAGQLGRARQAAGMGRQNPFFAAAHRHSFQAETLVFCPVYREPGAAPAARSRTSRLRESVCSVQYSPSSQQRKGGDPVSIPKPRSSAAVTRIPTRLEVLA